MDPAPGKWSVLEIVCHSSRLRALPHSVWQRTGTHPRHGDLTIEPIASGIADHDERHLRRIDALSKS